MARHHRQHPGRQPGGTGHRADMVQRRIDRGHAQIGNAPEGGLQPNDAAEGRRNADRAALIAAHRQIGLSRGHRHGAARGRSPGRAGRVPGVQHRSVHPGEACPRGAKTFAIGLADDARPCSQQVGYHRRILGRDEAVQQAGAVAHRHTGQRDGILQRDAQPGQRPRGRPLDPGKRGKGVQRVLAPCRARPGPDGGIGPGQRRQRRKTIHQPADQSRHGLALRRGQCHAKAGGSLQEIFGLHRGLGDLSGQGQAAG